MALLTVLAIAAKPFIPPKTLLLHPSPDTAVSIYGSPDMRGEKSTRWIDKSTYAWRCDYFRRASEPSCGFVISWNTTRADHLLFASEFPRCKSSKSDPDGDGWGWESEQSCVVVNQSNPGGVATQEAALTEYPRCTGTDSDPDGDGWGWENEASCVIRPEGLTAITAGDPVNANQGMPAADRTSAVMASAGTDGTVLSVDGSHYDGFLVKIHYEGRADYLRLNLRNSNPELRQKGYSEKFMSALLRTADLRAGPTYVSLSEFNIDEWWIFQENPPRALAAPEFGHIIQVAVVHSENGVHRVRVDEIQLIGERLSTEVYLTAILIFWIAYLMVELSVRYYRLRLSTRQHQDQLQNLASDAQRLEREKALLLNRSMTDPLTGTMNRAGIAAHLQQRYGSQNPPAGTGLVVMDIDHFKALNDTYGHAVGDSILQQFSALISASIREGDVFGRWGGEEFVAVVNQSSPENLRLVAEKLRQLVASHNFLPQQLIVSNSEVTDSNSQTSVSNSQIVNSKPHVTVSIGIARMRPDDSFDSAFKRADTALYQAKKSRNAVVYET